MASPTEIAAWGTVFATATGVIIKGMDAWLARRNKRDEETTKGQGLYIDAARIAIDAEKARDDADGKLITALLEERKSYQEEMRALRIEAAQERERRDREAVQERMRCDTEIAKLREHFETQIANERQIYNAHLEQLRGEIRKLIESEAELRAQNASLIGRGRE